jgi:hypothetical protein
MPSLRELAEQLSNKQTEDATKDDVAAVISLITSKTEVVEKLSHSLGEHLLAIAVVPGTALRDSPDQTADDDSVDPPWILAIVTTDIEVTDRDVNAVWEGPAILDPKAPARCLMPDFIVEEGRLLGSKHLVEQDVRQHFHKLRRIADRSDTPKRVSMAFLNAVVAYGTNEDAYVGGKLQEIRDRQAAAEPRELRREMRGAILASRISRREHLIETAVQELQKEASSAAEELGNVVWEMVHLDRLRDITFRAGSADFIEQLASGRVFDRGLLVRLSGACTHMKQLKDKFDKYVIGYAICGSWIARGHDARIDSDLDALILVDDLDVSKMTRRDLSDRLTAIVTGHGIEAAQSVGLPATAIHPTTFILSEGMKRIYEGNVVMFSMLSKAFVLFDPRGLLRSWQLLLREGALGPSAEYADSLLASCQNDVMYPYRRIRAAIVEDLYPGILAGAQSVLIRLGDRVLPPKAVAGRLKDFATEGYEGLDREAVLHLADTLDALVTLFGEFKRKPFMHVPAAQLEKLMAESEKALAFVERACDGLGYSHLGPRLPVNESSGPHLEG